MVAGGLKAMRSTMGMPLLIPPCSPSVSCQSVTSGDAELNGNAVLRIPPCSHCLADLPLLPMCRTPPAPKGNVGVVLRQPPIIPHTHRTMAMPLLAPPLLPMCHGWNREGGGGGTMGIQLLIPSCCTPESPVLVLCSDSAHVRRQDPWPYSGLARLWRHDWRQRQDYKRCHDCKREVAS